MGRAQRGKNPNHYAGWAGSFPGPLSSEEAKSLEACTGFRIYGLGSRDLFRSFNFFGLDFENNSTLIPLTKIAALQLAMPAFAALAGFENQGIARRDCLSGGGGA